MILTTLATLALLGGSQPAQSPPSPTAGASAARCHTRARGLFPDRTCTPGAVFPHATARDVCAPGWSARHRDVSYAKRQAVYRMYGLGGRHPFPEWEVDHLVPLELGGSNKYANLWPEHYPDAKDTAENTLHRAVCSGRMSLRTAQRIMRTDWTKGMGE